MLTSPSRGSMQPTATAVNRKNNMATFIIMAMLMVGGASLVGAQPLPMGVPDLCAGKTIIPANTTITFSGAVIHECVGVHGTLILASNTSLHVETLLVYPDGTLQVGTLTQPATNVQVVFADTPLDPVNDPEEWSHGLVTFGKTYIYGEPRLPTFVRLAQAPAMGATSLTLG